MYRSAREEQKTDILSAFKLLTKIGQIKDKYCCTKQTIIFRKIVQTLINLLISIIIEKLEVFIYIISILADNIKQSAEII